MKKIKRFLLLCLVSIVATGCVKYNGILTINKDKSMEFSIIYAFDKSLMSGESSSLKEEQFDNLKKEGYTVEKYSDEKFEGFKLIKKFNNIDEVSTDKDVEFNLSGMMNNTESDKYMFKLVKDGDKSTYYAKFKFDSNDSNSTTTEEDTEATSETLPDEDESLKTTGEDVVTTTGEDDDSTDGSNDSGLDFSALTSSMDLKFEVNLPNAAISTNATTKENDNKKLTWNLNYGAAQAIEFAFNIDAKGDSNILLYVGIGAGVLVLLLIILFLTKKKGPKEIVPVNDNKVEIKNEEDHISAEPVVKEHAEVMEDKE